MHDMTFNFHSSNHSSDKSFHSGFSFKKNHNFFKNRFKKVYTISKKLKIKIAVTIMDSNLSERYNLNTYTTP